MWKLGISAKPTSFIRDLAEYVTRGVLLFEAISIDCRRERATLLSRKVSGHRSTAMSKRTREEKTQSLEQLAKPDGIATGRKFAQSYGKVRLLIEHPHTYREWNIVGRCDVPGFFYWNPDSG